VPGNGLSGIEWLPKTREIVGGQIRQGGLIAVGLNGAVREIVPGNAIVTPCGLAFSPCGELAVSCEEGGMMVLVDPAGRASWFFDYGHYDAPTAFVVFAPNGTLYANGELTPGQPVRVIQLRPGGVLETFAAADVPCGAVRRPDGSLVVSECAAGRITELSPDGSRTILVQGLKYPQSLALDAQSNLYVVTGGVLAPHGGCPLWGDTILRISPQGFATVVARFERVSGLAVAPLGDLFVGIGGGVAVITQDGSAKEFAPFFPDPRGIAFDLAGNLYVSDNSLNGIARISGFPQGVLSGLVTDESGMAVAGARIQVLSDCGRAGS
jgi:DNA-binding beta-propeller fold protein YncE